MQNILDLLTLEVQKEHDSEHKSYFLSPKFIRPMATLPNNGMFTSHF
jgi:hypothetical protein